MNPEVGFGNSYPARECPEMPSPPGWAAGRDAATSDWARERPARNPYRAGSNEWRGYEFGVYLSDLP